MRAKAEETLKRLGVSIPTDKVMSELSVGQQQMIEICKALMVDAKVIIMDEPTAALTQSETEVLFEVMQSLRKRECPSSIYPTAWRKSLSFATAFPFSGTAHT